MNEQYNFFMLATRKYTETEGMRGDFLCYVGILFIISIDQEFN